MSRRTEKVGELLRRELAQMLIQGELRDPRLGPAHNISITAVHVAGDLGHARVFFDVLGEPKARGRALKALNASAGRIRSLLSGRVEMRRLPNIHFELDESIERGIRMEKLFEELAEEKVSVQDDPEAVAADVASPSVDED